MEEFIKRHKIKFLYLFLFLIYVGIAFAISNFALSFGAGDEIWNYGFSYNISEGMIPYKDFSLLQTPLYFYIGSLFIKIFGSYLFSLHIFDAIFIALIMLMLFKMHGWKTCMLFPLFIVQLIPTYNFLCLFWLFLIIFLINQKKDNELLISFIVGLVFITKQSIGIMMFIPLIFYSKNKIKSLLVFLIPFIVLSLYLLFNGALFDFIDHSFLGMLDFGGNNKLISEFTYLEIVIVLILSILLIKSDFKDKILFYILSFQIMSYPIFEFFHWLVAFIPVYYYLFVNFNFKEIKDSFLNLFKFLIICSFILAITFGMFLNIKFSNIVVNENDDNYLFLRNISRIEHLDLDEQVHVINKYIDEYDSCFFIVQNSYLIKLYMSLDINKYDMLLNGNMGYKGDERILNNIIKTCKKESCVFVVENSVFNGKYNQFNEEIYNYVRDSYELLDEYKYFNIYVNSD